MCGIVGIVHRDPTHSVAPAVIRQMCDAIRHRGPDDEGVYVDGPVGLGMRRLSIIDLAGSHQPIFNEDRSAVIVFNGEIYNYAELRRGLVARGHTFATQGDTETILHLYEEEGPACVARLRGMFAFAIWDAKARTLLLARDRFGIKPLYVATAPWGIAFASELKALHAAGLADRTLDWDALDMYFQLGYIPAPATPFAGVTKLEPGHTALWRAGGGGGGGLSTRQYRALPRGRGQAPRDVGGLLGGWLGGARRHIGLLAGERYARLPHAVQWGLSGLANLLREPRGASLSVDRFKRFLRPGNGSTPDRFLGYVTRCADGDRRALYVAGLHEGLAAGRASARFRELHERHGAPAGLSAGLYLDYKTFLADDVLALSDRLAMAHSLEIRVPFVDHVLVERVFPLPDRTKIGLWRNKRRLKRAARGRLPPGHLRGAKRGVLRPRAGRVQAARRDRLPDTP